MRDYYYTMSYFTPYDALERIFKEVIEAANEKDEPVYSKKAIDVNNHNNSDKYECKCYECCEDECCGENRCTDEDCDEEYCERCDDCMCEDYCDDCDDEYCKSNKPAIVFNNVNSYSKIKYAAMDLVDKVIYSKGTTVVFWKDGSEKTIVKTQSGDKFDKVTGLAMAIIKHLYGNKGAYMSVLDYIVNNLSEDEDEKKLKREQKKNDIKEESKPIEKSDVADLIQKVKETAENNNPEQEQNGRKRISRNIFN